MKIIRNDSESLVCRSTGAGSATVGVAVFIGIPMVAFGCYGLIAHKPILLFAAFSAVVSLGLVFGRMPTSTTFTFARETRRFFLMSQYLAKQTCEEFGFDDIRAIEIVRSPNSLDRLYIVLCSGRRILVSMHDRCEEAQMHEDAALLRETLGLPEHEEVAV